MLSGMKDQHEFPETDHTEYPEQKKTPLWGKIVIWLIVIALAVVYLVF